MVLRMTPQLRAFLAFPVLAAACALVSGALAGPARRLPWTGTPPPLLAAAPAPPAPGTAAGPAAAPLAALPPVAAPRPATSAPASPTPATPQPPPSAERAEARFPPRLDAVTRDLDSAEALEAWRLGIPFLDARRSAEYAAGHVAGAHAVPVWEADADARLTAFEARVPWTYRAPLVLYCSGGDCDDSQRLAAKLVALGYRNLLLYRGGWPDWSARRRPSATGAP